MLVENNCEETKILEFCEMCRVYLADSQLLSVQGCDLYPMQSTMGQINVVTKKFEQNKYTCRAYLAGKDVLVLSPTESVESLSFDIASFVFDIMRHGEREELSLVCLNCVCGR